MACYCAAGASRPAYVLEASRHATFKISHSDPQRSPGRGRGPFAYPDGTRGLLAQGGRRRLFVSAARLAGHPEDFQNYPRGNEPRRRAGGLPARGDSGRALAGVGTLGPVRRAASALQGSQGRGLRHRTHPRRSHGGSRARRRAQLPAIAAQSLPDSVQVSRRAARARRADARPRVHHEGCIFLPRQRRGCAARVPKHVRHVHAHLHTLWARVPGGGSRHRRHRWFALARIPGIDRHRRGRPACVRCLFLRRQRGGGKVARARGCGAFIGHRGESGDAGPADD